MSRFGGRKFLGFITILTAAGLAKFYTKTGLTDQDVYLLIGLYGTFAFGNVANTLAALKSGGNGGSSGAPAAPALPADFVERISSLERTSSAILGGVDMQNQALHAVLMNLGPTAKGPRAVEEVDSADPELVTQAKANRAAISQYVRPN